MSDVVKYEGTQQYWKEQIIGKGTRFPFVLVDNWYTPEEEKAVWKELDFISAAPKESIKRAEKTVVARDPKGNSLSKAYRFYLEDFYNNRNKSHILNCTYKQRTDLFHDYTNHCEPFNRSFNSSNKDTSLVSYYEENDHYKPHHDVFLWTCLIWMVKEPRLFDGGNFILNESETEIKLKNNRLVMFPSCYLHSVTPIKFHTKPKEIGYGRYTITHFYYSIPKYYDPKEL